MSAPKKVSIEQIIEAYRSTGSVWKSAKQLGLCGQSVWERLRAIDYPMGGQRWTTEEVAELRALVEAGCSAGEAAKRLGRPFAGVAGKLSELRLFTRRSPQGRLFPALKRGSGVTKEVIKGWARDLHAWKGSLKQFAVSRGVPLEAVAQGLQRYFPEVWEAAVPKLDAPPQPCPHCGREFIPATKRQRCCSRRCSGLYRNDQQYFGGQRKFTVGLAEGRCQLCQRETKSLASHHVLGKENDPDNTALIALCGGCHQVVGTLAGRKFVDTEDGWMRLIELVLLRRFGAATPGRPAGFHVGVDIDWLTEEDIETLTADEYDAAVVGEPRALVDELHEHASRETWRALAEGR